MRAIIALVLGILLLVGDTTQGTCNTYGNVGFQFNWPKSYSDAEKLAFYQLIYDSVDDKEPGATIVDTGYYPYDKDTCSDSGTFCAELWYKRSNVQLEDEDVTSMNEVTVYRACLTDMMAALVQESKPDGTSEADWCNQLKNNFCREYKESPKDGCRLRCGEGEDAVREPSWYIWKAVLGFTDYAYDDKREKRELDAILDGYYVNGLYETCKSVPGIIDVVYVDSKENEEGDDLYDLGQYTVEMDFYFAQGLATSRAELQACIEEFMDDDGNGVGYKLSGAVGAKLGLAAMVATVAFMFA